MKPAASARIDYLSESSHGLRKTNFQPRGSSDRGRGLGGIEVSVAMHRAEINGIEGMFVIDTGASFVTLTPSFAGKAKPQLFKTDGVEIQTVNGKTSATLATVESVKLAGLSASGVPAIVTSKSLGDGIDGLLGMSFLSRFTVVIQDRDIQLKAKTLEE